MECVDFRKGVWTVRDKGKYTSKTNFYGIAYDEGSDTSLVICQPVTGRTHQIRVHLQHIKYPIDNDPNYGPNAALVAINEDGELIEDENTKIVPWVPPIMIQ